MLIVEDEMLVAMVLGEELTNLDHEVVVAAEGQQALEAALAASPPFDLLLTDLRMPRLTGEALVQRLRAHHPDLPVVA